jgi:anti-sigma factor ChrR (cupin superfamily)
MNARLAMEHPTMEELFSFAEGQLDREETWGILAHLLQGCRSCRLTASRLMTGGRRQEIRSLPV